MGARWSWTRYGHSHLTPPFPNPSSSPVPLSQLPGWSLRPDGSIVIATGNDDALGLYRCTPYNSYGTAGESRPTRVLLKVRSPSGSPPGSAPPAKPPKLPLCLAGPSCLHGAAQGGIFPGGGPGAGDPLHGSRGSPPHHHLGEGRGCCFEGPVKPPWRQRLLLASRASFLEQCPCPYITPVAIFLYPQMLGPIPNWGPITWLLKGLWSLCLAVLYRTEKNMALGFQTSLRVVGHIPLSKSPCPQCGGVTVPALHRGGLVVAPHHRVHAPQVGSVGKSSAQVDGNSSLILHPLIKEQHGVWECTATNQVASITAATSVHVLGELLVTGGLGWSWGGQCKPHPVLEGVVQARQCDTAAHQVPVPTLSLMSPCSHCCWQPTSPGSQALMEATSRGSASGTPHCECPSLLCPPKGPQLRTHGSLLSPG